MPTKAEIPTKMYGGLEVDFNKYPTYNDISDAEFFKTQKLIMERAKANRSNKK